VGVRFFDFEGGIEYNQEAKIEDVERKMER